MKVKFEFYTKLKQTGVIEKDMDYIPQISTWILYNNKRYLIYNIITDISNNKVIIECNH